MPPRRPPQTPMSERQLRGRTIPAVVGDEVGRGLAPSGAAASGAAAAMAAYNDLGREEQAVGRVLHFRNAKSPWQKFKDIWDTKFVVTLVVTIIIGVVTYKMVQHYSAKGDIRGCGLWCIDKVRDGGKLKLSECITLYDKGYFQGLYEGL